MRYNFINIHLSWQRKYIDKPIRDKELVLLITFFIVSSFSILFNSHYSLYIFCF
jgi:hypothetical protein